MPLNMSGRNAHFKSDTINDVGGDQENHDNLTRYKEDITDNSVKTTNDNSNNNRSTRQSIKNAYGTNWAPDQSKR